MFYYWLVPILVVGVLAIWFFGYNSDKKSKVPGSGEQERPEAIKRGRFINK